MLDGAPPPPTYQQQQQRGRRQAYAQGGYPGYEYDSSYPYAEMLGGQI